jgi:hypothetical protein
MKVETHLVLAEENAQFINQFERYGFGSQEELLERALQLLRLETERQQLISSADLYSTLYETDQETQDWVQSSMNDWK